MGFCIHKYQLRYDYIIGFYCEKHTPLKKYKYQKVVILLQVKIFVSNTFRSR
jgi:hypothetical protein